jgi:hypothetical protein
MKYTGKYFRKLEKRFGGYLTKEQLHDSAAHVHFKFFNDSNKSIIIFCNADYKRKVAKNYYLKLLVKNKSHALIYSKIIPRDCSLKKRKVFYVFEVNKIFDDYKIVWSKEYPIKMNQCYNILKIINSGRPMVEEVALLVARFFKIYTGGFAPVNYNTIYGMKKNSGLIFGLTQSDAANKDVAAKENILNSDATIYIGSERNSLRRFRTLIKKTDKSFFYITDSEVDQIFRAPDDSIDSFRDIKERYVNWIIDNKIKTVNITGFINNKSRMLKTYAALVRLMSKNKVAMERINKKFESTIGLLYE